MDEHGSSPDVFHFPHGSSRGVVQAKAKRSMKVTKSVPGVRHGYRVVRLQER